MPATLTEADLEAATLVWLAELGYTTRFGPEIAPGASAAERDDYTQVVLLGRLRAALLRLNPALPAEACAEALRQILHPNAPALLANNRTFHRMLVAGVAVEYRRPDGSLGGELVRLVDIANPANNDWLAVNQFTVAEGQHKRRPDIVLFLNGLPLVVLELKNPADEQATVWMAWQQVQTYKAQIATLFLYNAALIISDGHTARVGTLTADKEWFMPWRTIEGETVAPTTLLELEVLTRGMLAPHHLLALLRSFIVFEEDESGSLVKKLAGYHQFHAVNKAVDATLEATAPTGDRRAGVVWHTQGSGKSLTMAFYAGRIIQAPAMANPTLVVITDRNDLDDQLFGTFARCHELLRQTPIQATDRNDLRAKLEVAAGGVIFTTIQKFLPEVRGERSEPLSMRRNIVVIADEAHRSQYGFEAKLDTKSGTLTYGFAQHVRDALPAASFIGFTGTPIELTDRNTRAVFGDYISIYDIQRAVQDRATVPIYYESRLAKLALDETERPNLDQSFEEVTEGEEVTKKEQLKSKWAALEAVVGAERRIALLAKDLVEHFAQRLEVMEGKAMIVCMSRRICIDLYQALIALCPQWHSDDDNQGALKIVMTGSASDPLAWQPHIRNKARREALANRFKNASDPLKLVIVRDMWLTGFDAPSLHTMYVDKPMRGHGLMQAIARVNRVFKDKPGGLIVDYLGLADSLREAMANYTANGGSGQSTLAQEDAVAIMQEKHELCCNLFHGFDWSVWANGSPIQRLALLPPAQEHILAQEDGKNRLLQAVTQLSRAFALAIPHDEAIAIRDDVAFFQAIHAALAKTPSNTTKTATADLDQAIRQLVAKAIAPDHVIDIFAAAGIKKPDISILSDEFLAEVRGIPHKNVAIELLRKLLADEIKTRSRSNAVQGRSFSAMLERSLRAYQNRALETAQIIEELIKLAEELRTAQQRGEELGLNEDELAFYEALEVNDSAVKVLGDETLKTIARELVETVRRNATIDWTLKESARAKLRVMVKRLLRKHGYPPDKRECATLVVLEQATLRAAEWAG
ncbi:type I restriction endonuclease subunit R [Candidatus Viridilinea mediisalina]|uniref:Type I restriction enzyme endonuclease subunit n=1 Tax=Candidatus Viridilinea mediisalina TaxID=2024553 RepID=A0A2A6RNR0_9CHLR|nr:type I restriction endonuclease subunit R [Candidatus Viridilinea mediisalina]PDW04687.1 DEAD/DEAH box helicase [Candidatus Viridilinea mediisalina]